MKRLVLMLSIVFCMSIALTGCGGGDFKDEPETTSLTGVLTEQTTGDNYLGTHLLTDDEKTVTPLRSLAINLSSSQYLDNEVQVMGFLNEDDGVFEVTGISVIEILQEDSVKAKFVPYKNTDFGIQLKYYDDWELDERTDKLVFTAPVVKGEIKGDTIEISQFPFDGSGDGPLEAFMSERHPEIDQYDFNKIGVDTMDAVKVEKGENMVDYYVYRSGFVYRISFIASENFVASNKKVFNEMLSEFRFTGFTVEQDKITDAGLENMEEEEIVPEEEEISELPVVNMEFATFESSIYHFSAKYPSSWYYAGVRGEEEGVRHHYGFSDESVTEENEFISMDIVSGDLPSGQTLNLENGQGVKVIESSGAISIYISVDGQNFRVRGPKEYEDLMTVMASSITPVEVDEEA